MLVTFLVFFIIRTDPIGEKKKRVKKGEKFFSGNQCFSPTNNFTWLKFLSVIFSPDLKSNNGNLKKIIKFIIP